MQVSKEGILVAGEGEVSRRYRNADVNAHHAAVRLHGKLSGIVAAGSEDAGTVGEGIRIHHTDSLFIILNPLDAGHRSKDFLISHAHPGLHMIQNRRSYKEAFFIARNHEISSVKHQLCTFVDSLLNPLADLLFVFLRYHRS